MIILVKHLWTDVNISFLFKVFLGGNIFLEKGKWDLISNNVKDTIFVKDLATAIWGKDNLKGRSLEGIPCNRLKSQGATSKPALTPEKLAVVKGKCACQIIQTFWLSVNLTCNFGTDASNDH